MKYTDKYPNIRAKDSEYQGNYKDLSLMVEENLRYTDRWSVCFVCRAKTPFADETSQHPVHICSEECRAELFEWDKEYPDPKEQEVPMPPEEDYSMIDGEKLSDRYDRKMREAMELYYKK